MMDESKMSMALASDASRAEMPGNLLARIQARAGQADRSRVTWPKRWWMQVAVAGLLLLPLAGFAAKQIWVVPALEAPGTSHPHRPTKELALTELAAAVDFPVKFPAYLPEGATLFASLVAGDSTDANALLRIVEVSYVKQGAGAIVIEQWRAGEASAFPPGHPFVTVIDTEPWHKTLGSDQVEIEGVNAKSLSYLISGMNMNRVYWNENGINYAVAADSSFAMTELLKVAGSLK